MGLHILEGRPMIETDVRIVPGTFITAGSGSKPIIAIGVPTGPHDQVLIFVGNKKKLYSEFDLRALSRAARKMF